MQLLSQRPDSTQSSQLDNPFVNNIDGMEASVYAVFFEIAMHHETN